MRPKNSIFFQSPRNERLGDKTKLVWTSWLRPSVASFGQKSENSIAPPAHIFPAIFLLPSRTTRSIHRSLLQRLGCFSTASARSGTSTRVRPSGPHLVQKSNPLWLQRVSLVRANDGFQSPHCQLGRGIATARFRWFWRRTSSTSQASVLRFSAH